ncbi:hypothetical protein COF68_05480 [Bacillus toyonensis]|uniref:hypothetical protein n=1 Tax=Bacillus toyonensis TaxID=155322 RepID=UPI000BFDA0E0|nr:hypothetical protein [Bacillus toyonensis]PHE64294.1 hypothetical protein COF68_05480 [Bacillus toyonensis]
MKNKERLIISEHHTVLDSGVIVEGYNVFGRVGGSKNDSAKTVSLKQYKGLVNKLGETIKHLEEGDSNESNEGRISRKGKDSC